MEGTEALAVEAYLAGRHDQSVELWLRGFQERAAAGEPERAASCAYWLAFISINRNEYLRARGWAGRGLELLGDRECPERGYLVMARGMTHLLTGETAEALALIEQARTIAESYDDDRRAGWPTGARRRRGSRRTKHPVVHQVPS